MNSRGQVYISFVMACSRGEPRRQITVQLLELFAARTGAQITRLLQTQSSSPLVDDVDRLHYGSHLSVLPAHDICCTGVTRALLSYISFIGGERDLQKAFDHQTPALHEALERSKVRFLWNPPHAPHFGGAWEREVRAIESALHVTLIKLLPRKCSQQS